MTLIDSSCRIAGVVEDEGDLEIAGQVEGRVQARATVAVRDGAVVRAEIRAHRVEVGGTVVGDIIAEDRIEIRASARVVGDLRAPVVEFNAGAQLDGRIQRQLAVSEATSVEPAPRTLVRARSPFRHPEPPPEPQVRAATEMPVAEPPAEPRPPRLPARARIAVRPFRT